MIELLISEEQAIAVYMALQKTKPNSGSLLDQVMQKIAGEMDNLEQIRAMTSDRHNDLKLSHYSEEMIQGYVNDH